MDLSTFAVICFSRRRLFTVATRFSKMEFSAEDQDIMIHQYTFYIFQDKFHGSLEYRLGGFHSHLQAVYCVQPFADDDSRFSSSSNSICE